MDAVVVVAGSALFGYGLLNWRHAVIVALVLSVFEGVLRKWVVPDFGQAIYFAKDIVLLGGYATFFGGRLLRHKRLVQWHPVSPVLVGLGVLVFLQFLMATGADWRVGLFGVKAYLMYVPLMYMVPAIFPDVVRLRQFSVAYLALALIPMSLGIVQFSEPADSALNRYAWQDERGPGAVAVFGSTEKVRITGTFSYISGYTAYLTLICLVGIAVAMSTRKWGVRWAVYGVQVMVLGNILMTGSRGPVLMLGVAVAALLGMTLGQRARGRRVAGLAACAVLPVIVLMAGSAFPEAQAAFFDRARDSTDVAERVSAPIRESQWALGEAGFLGYGIGTAHQATRFMVPQDATYVLPPEAEGEWARIVLELGPLGLFLVLLARITVAFHLWGRLRKAESSDLYPFLASSLLFTVLNIPGNLVFNHTAAIFYWFVAGFALVSAEAPGRLSVQPAVRPRQDTCTRYRFGSRSATF
jgi:hypothetical protein